MRRAFIIPLFAPSYFEKESHMSVNPINTPYGSGQSLADDIQALQSLSNANLQIALANAQAAYDAAQTQLNAATTLAAQINSDIQNLVLLVQQNASAAAIQAAKTTLNSDLNTLSGMNVFATNGTSPTSVAARASQYLVDVRFEIFNRAMNASTQLLTGGYIPPSGPFGTGGSGSPGGLLAVGDYDITTAVNNLTTAQAAYITALNDFNANETTIQSLRLDELNRINTNIGTVGYMIMQNSNQSSWAGIAQQYLPTNTGDLDYQISAALTQRTQLQSALSTAQTTYEAGVNAPATATPPGLVALLTSKGTAAQTYIDTINATRAAIDAQQTATLAQITQADQAAYAAHMALYPSQDPTLTALQQAAADAVTAAQSGIKLSLQPALSTTFPELPPPGVRMSMSQLMNYIANSQVLMTQIAKNSTLDTAALVGRRLQILTAIMSALSVVMSRANGYASYIINADMSYAAQLYQVNQDRYDAQVAALNALLDYRSVNQSVGGGFGGNNDFGINSLNASIDIINQQNRELSNSLDATTRQQFNDANASVVDVLNQSETLPPGVVNTLDNTGADPTVPTPTPFPAPAPIPTTSPTIPTIDQINEFDIPYVPVTYSSQAQVDAYNAKITALNDKLGPIAAQLAAESSNQPPYVFTPIPLLYYDNVHVRTQVSDVINLSALQQQSNVVSGMIQVLSNAIIENFALAVSPAVLKYLTPGTIFSAPNSSKQQGTAGKAAGNTMVTADAGASAGTVGAALTSILSQTQFAQFITDILEETSLLAGLKSSAVGEVAAAPTVRGLLADIEEPTAAEAAKREKNAAVVQDAQLTAVSDTLLSTSQDVSLLSANAQLLAAQIPEFPSLTPQEKKELIDTLIAIQQLVFVFIAGLAASAVGNPTAEEGLKKLQNLFQGLTTALPAAPIPVTSNSFFTLPDRPPITLGDVLSGRIPEDLTPAEVVDLRTQINQSFAAAGIPVEISNESPLNVGARDALNAARDQIIQNLGVNLNALPEDVQARLIRVVDTATPALTSLTPEQKASIAVGSALGVLTPAQTGAFLSGLVAIQTNGATPENVSALAAVIGTGFAPVTPIAPSAVAVATGAPETFVFTPTFGPGTPENPEAAAVTEALVGFNETNRVVAEQGTEQAKIDAVAPRVTTLHRDTAITPETTIPGVTLRKFKEVAEKLSVDEGDRRVFTNLLNSFTDSIVTQTNFYQFAIHMILDPANYFIKNFSLITAEKGKGGMFPGSTNTIPV